MFERFGEFDSAEGLNMTAAGLLTEGDKDSLLILAQENGIDTEDANDYIAGDTQELCTSVMAAIGKLEIESKEHNSKQGIEKMALSLITTMAKGMCTEPAVATGIRRKGKRIHEILELMRNVASTHKQGNIGMSCGTDRQLQGIIRAYYTEGKEAAKQQIESLYA